MPRTAGQGSTYRAPENTALSHAKASAIGASRAVAEWSDGRSWGATTPLEWLGTVPRADNGGVDTP